MIRINKLYGYLFGLALTFIIYFFGQLIFFMNTDTAQGKICDITDKAGGIRYRGRVEVFYACFVTKDGESVKFRTGSNLDYSFEEPIKIIYKRNNPKNARIDNFTELWMLPSLYYLIAFAIIMGIITAIYYGNRYVVITKKPFRVSTIPGKTK